MSWPHRCVRDWVSHKSLTTLGLGRQTSFFLPKHNHQSQRCVLKKKAFLFKYAGVQSTGGKLWEGSHPNGDTSLAFWVRFGWTYHIQRLVLKKKRRLTLSLWVTWEKKLKSILTLTHNINMWHAYISVYVCWNTTSGVRTPSSGVQKNHWIKYLNCA